MTAIRTVLPGLALLLAAGCGAEGDGDPVEAGKGGWSIPAGVYGNVAPADGKGDPAGIELFLDRGSESETIELVLCDSGCSPVEKSASRRGMNGISFTIYDAGRPVDVMVTPGGGDAVDVSLDRGQGLTTHRLKRIPREDGLAAARAKSADSAMMLPAPAVPPVPSSPPPLPSPTP